MAAFEENSHDLRGGWEVAVPRGGLMAGFIVLPDGRAYAASERAYDRVIECIAEVIIEREEGRALSKWLLEQRSLVQGSGLGSVDVRQLTLSNGALFLDAVKPALERATVRVRWAGVIQKPFAHGWSDFEIW